jgi:hypothetical protein
MNDSTCAACGSSRVEAGAIESASLRLEKTSTRKKIFSVGMQVKCLACFDCGAVTRLRVDPKAMASALE